MAEFSLLNPSQQTAKEEELLGELESIVCAINDDECAQVSLSAEELAQRVSLARDALQRTIAYCHEHPAGFAGEEERVCVQLLPIVQSYGLLQTKSSTFGVNNTDCNNIDSNIDNDVNINSDGNDNDNIINGDGGVANKDSSTSDGVEICGLCCSLLCLLIEHSLHALSPQTPSLPSSANNERHTLPQTHTTTHTDSHTSLSPSLVTDEETESEKRDAWMFLHAHTQMLAQLGSMGWCDTLVTLLFAHIEDETLAELVVYALSLLLRRGPEENCVLLMQSDCCEAIVEVLTLHSDNASLTLTCVEVIALLVETSLEIREQLGECGVCEAVTEALRYALSQCSFFSLIQQEQREENEEDNTLREKSAEEEEKKEQEAKQEVNEYNEYKPPCVLVSPSSSLGSSSPISSEIAVQASVSESKPNDELTIQSTVSETVIEPGMVTETAIVTTERSPEEIAFFVAKACWLIGRLCDGCFENKRLFGESDACDVLVDVLKLYSHTHALSEQTASPLSPHRSPTLSLHDIDLLDSSPTEMDRLTASAVVLSWCCYAIGELAESHDENQWKFGDNAACLSVVKVLKTMGSDDVDLCVLASQALRQLIECSELNKRAVVFEGQLGDTLIHLLHKHMRHVIAVQWLSRLLAILLTSSLSERTELSAGRQVCGCEGGTMLVEVLMNHIDNKEICSHTINALASLLSIVDEDGNELATDEILRAGAVAIVQEAMGHYPKNEDLVEFGELILDKLSPHLEELFL